MATQYKRVKLSKTGVVSAHRIDEGGTGTSSAAQNAGDDLRDEDDDLDLAPARKQSAGRNNHVLDDEDSDEGAPDPAPKPQQKVKKQRKQSAGASTSKSKRSRSRKQHSDDEVSFLTAHASVQIAECLLHCPVQPLLHWAEEELRGKHRMLLHEAFKLYVVAKIRCGGLIEFRHISI
jgi:hypothetical protein